MAGNFLGQYMVLMMGFFAVYAGLVYNDCFSLGLNLFGTRYEFVGQDILGTEHSSIVKLKAPFGTDEMVYSFELDPVWHVASNELLFLNSFKMKLLVIFGILQMCMGTIIRGINTIYLEEKNRPVVWSDSDDDFCVLVVCLYGLYDFPQVDNQLEWWDTIGNVSFGFLVYIWSKSKRMWFVQ